MPGSVSKAQIRSRIWEQMTRQGVVLFPGAYGRTPNFSGAADAVTRLRALEAWGRARRVLVLGEPVLQRVREAAIAEGKTVVVPDLSLCGGGWILEIDPGAMGRDSAAEAARACGCAGSAPAAGVRALHGHDTAPVDLMVIGAVGVNRRGARVGRGAGGADLTYALARDRGILRSDTPVAVLVHSLQLFDEPLDREPTDVPIDWIVTPDQAIAVETVVMRPKGLHPSMITPKRLEAYPRLREILEREGYPFSEGDHPQRRAS
jgi:5-formyltetrahydrofolate cyclo-ligase